MVMNHVPYCTTKASNDNHVMNTHFPKLAEIIFSCNRKLTFKNDHFKILFLSTYWKVLEIVWS